jgi:hypothetical protein
MERLIRRMRALLLEIEIKRSTRRIEKEIGFEVVIPEEPKERICGDLTNALFLKQTRQR